MIIILNGEWKEEIKAFLNEVEKENYQNFYRYQTQKGKIKVDVDGWSDESLINLVAFLKSKADAGDRSAKLSQSLVEKFQRIKLNPGEETVGRLEQLTAPMRYYIGESEHRYLFQQTEDGNLVPWFVANIEYKEGNGRCITPPTVELTLMAFNMGEATRDGYGSKTLPIRTEHIQKRTMGEILAGFGFYLETPELIKQYQEELKTYLTHCDEDGFQMSVIGKCYMSKGWYSRGWRTVESAGRPARMVIDPPERTCSPSGIHAKFWDENEENIWILPLHPVYEMFDLGAHTDYRVHVNNAVPYVYDDKVDQKLVLPRDVKDFMSVLIEHSKSNFKDIIIGKEGGTVVIIDGKPGIGKTLSAEVYSEKMHRPLYRVQSSQLGTEPEAVEKQLKEVLERSERWGAILLIDEADVYIRARGIDIQQNAIVGVFLRVLEYYRGVLFMTTNLGNTVDDAIISRCTAHFSFENPTSGEQFELWEIMSEQNNLGFENSEIHQIVKMMPDLSGRDIKNLIKLAMIYAAGAGKRVDPEMIKFVSRFKQSGKN